MGRCYAKFTVAAVQAASVFYDLEKTTDKAVRLIEEAADKGADHWVSGVVHTGSPGSLVSCQAGRLSSKALAQEDPSSFALRLTSDSWLLTSVFYVHASRY